MENLKIPSVPSTQISKASRKNLIDWLTRYKDHFDDTASEDFIKFVNTYVADNHKDLYTLIKRKGSFSSSNFAMYPVMSWAVWVNISISTKVEICLQVTFSPNTVFVHYKANGPAHWNAQSIIEFSNYFVKRIEFTKEEAPHVQQDYEFETTWERADEILQRAIRLSTEDGAPEIKI
jgi:hypothetical protein